MTALTMTNLLRAETELKQAADVGRAFTALYAPLTLPDRALEFDEDDMAEIAEAWRRDGPGRIALLADHAGTGAGTEALGWIADLRAVKVGARTDLVVTPTWIPAGKAKISDGSYKFVSVGFKREHDKYRLVECSLTNFPATFPGLDPIQLSQRNKIKLFLLETQFDAPLAAAEEPTDIVSLFHAACMSIVDAEHCTDREALPKAAAKHPALWRAYTCRSDARKLFLALVEHRVASTRCDLSAGYKWAAKCEPAAAVLMDVYLGAR